MTSKLELQSVINKYYLNGLIEAVKWDIKDKQLNVVFTSPTREMLGKITYNNIPLPDSSVGISNTTQLLKLINITSKDILLNYIQQGKTPSKLIISDQQFTVNYTLADTLTIPKSGAYNGSEEYNLETELDVETVSALIKAKSALSESDTVMIQPTTSLDGDFQVEMIFGGDIEYSNKISYYLSNFIQKDVPTNFSLGFNSDLLKEILNVNKEFDKAKLSINLEGLMKLEFQNSSTTSIYYIVKKNI